MLFDEGVNHSDVNEMGFISKELDVSMFFDIVTVQLKIFMKCNLWMGLFISFLSRSF